MAFQISPGVLVTETDLTSVVPAVATATGAFAGNFQWGPANYPTLVSSENELVSIFGKPNDTVSTSFFSAANFLSYSASLRVIRTVGAAARNAVSNGTAELIENIDDYTLNHSTGTLAIGGRWCARYPGTLGNSLKVVVIDSGNWAVTNAMWKSYFSAAPATSAFASNAGASNDELHVLVIDEDGYFTGTKNSILEKYEFLSKASDARKSDNTTNYYKDVISNSSRYIWWLGHHDSTTDDWGQTALTGAAFDTMTAAAELSLTSGVDASPTEGEIQTAYTLFNNEQIDISLVFTGAATAATVGAIANGLIADRKDCMLFFSPNSATTGTTAPATIVTNCTDFGTAVTALVSGITQSYCVMDSGWKYQYDRYNDVYRWIPLNADIAGLTARTEYTNDAWWSPGGLTRGQIKNAIKLSVNPNKTQRDSLYAANINPVVTFPGDGTVLYGDKTLLRKPSAFDRINVRRLFIVLEKSIAISAKYQLFEFNDAFTRAQFKNIVEPFLRDVQGRRGVTDFKVVCDESNNTSSVIDRNEFVADIYIKPSRSINYITLNFVAARSGVNFEEIGA